MQNGGCQEWPGEGTCLKGTEFQFFKMKGDLQLGGSDGYTTMGMYLASLDCALKVVNLANFMYILSQLEKKNFKGIPFRKNGKNFLAHLVPIFKDFLWL